jgi:hypothetical protein
MPQPPNPYAPRSNDPLPETDSIRDGREREKRFRAESLQREAEREQQEQRQRDRQARHEAQARQVDEQVRAQIFLRLAQAQQAKPPAEEPPIRLTSQRQDEQLAAEQEAGRRALEKYAKKNTELPHPSGSSNISRQTQLEQEAGRRALEGAKLNEVSQNPPTQSTLNPRKIP